MYIDLEKAKREFMNYTNNYNQENVSISRKVFHSLRVMDISSEIAQKMNLSQEDVEIASVIGLLHDIGRFEQQTKFQTFNDLHSFDHGDVGVQILEKQIRKFIATSQYDRLIKVSVKNHNKFQIEDGLNDRELFFAKLIRDADKIDILYEATEIFWQGQEEIIRHETISPQILETLYHKQLIKNENDTDDQPVNSVIRLLAFIFDINFDESFEIIKSKDYLNKIINRFDTNSNDTWQSIRNFLNHYLENIR
ncbi:MAG: HD domain-containing protein [Clostridia bacterium]|nr:HD domain-containing protein [Clostridia bacterium]